MRGLASDDMKKRFPISFAVLLRVFERLLAVIVLAAVCLSAIGNAHVLIDTDWKVSESLYEFINRALLLVIALELARMLVTHDLLAVLELLAFVIARKMLKPDMSSLDISLGVLAFVALLLARRLMSGGGTAENNPNAAPDRNTYVSSLG